MESLAAITRSTLFLSLGAVGFAVAPPQSPDLLAASVSHEALFLIDGDDLSATLLGNLGPVGVLGEIVRATDDSVFIIDRATDNLLTVSICDGAVDSVVTLDQDFVTKPRGRDVAPDGVLYGVFPGMELRSIDPSTGATTFVTTLSGAIFIEAMAFSPSGTLYAAGTPAGVFSDTLYTVNLTTGEMTVVGYMGSYDVDALTWAPDGFLYGAEPDGATPTPIYQIDPATASLVHLGDTTVLEVNGLLAGPGIDDENSNGQPDLCDEIGTNYCTANPNSSGSAASISAFGSTAIADNDLTLVTVDAAANHFGYFLMSQGQDFVPFFAGSEGNLCLAQPIARFNHPPTGEVLFSGDEGVLVFSPDLFNLPQGIMFQPGDTWYFQSWFRDVVGGNFTSNTSDGVAITWE